MKTIDYLKQLPAFLGMVAFISLLVIILAVV
jgi:hypothetical protein